MKWLEFILSLVSRFLNGNKEGTSNLLLDTVNNLTTNHEQTFTNQNNNSISISELFLQLDKMGYYKYTHPSRLEEVKKEDIKNDYFSGWDTGRIFLADAESLGQHGVADFFKYYDDEMKGTLEKQSVEEFLKNQNVIINVSDEHRDTDGYYIIINGCKYEIYSEKEINEDWWTLSSVRCFSIINKLLKEAGSKERIYALADGNDQNAIFLTEEMYELINSCNYLQEKSKPRNIGNAF